MENAKHPTSLDIVNPIGEEVRLRNQRPTIFIDNLNKSLKLPNINLAGVLAEPVQLGDPAKIWTRLAITSDEPPFHRIVESLSQVISHNAQAMGARISLNQANNVLLVIHSDDSADLWVDAAAVSICAILKRDIVPGSAVFESDIADVTGITFPAISILPSDRMVYLFRENWRFGLFFDLRTDTDLSVDDVASKLGYLYRVMRYSHLYEMLENETTFGSLIKTGWFPFAEIIGTEFDSLLYASKAGFDLAGVELDLISNFSETRLDHMFARWITKPHFAIKKPILKSAMRAFISGDPVAVLKIVLTEIEGILAEAHHASVGHRAKIKALRKFASASAEKKTGSLDTLLFPSAFEKYLDRYTYANFDPSSQQGTAGSRHAVVHGAASCESYTQVKALQALLTLDQIAFYT